jgi:hypothetical protein
MHTKSKLVAHKKLQIKENIKKFCLGFEIDEAL